MDFSPFGRSEQGCLAAGKMGNDRPPVKSSPVETDPGLPLLPAQTAEITRKIAGETLPTRCYICKLLVC
jgi:hypothetical protein